MKKILFALFVGFIVAYILLEITVLFAPDMYLTMHRPGNTLGYIVWVLGGPPFGTWASVAIITGTIFCELEDFLKIRRQCAMGEKAAAERRLTKPNPVSC